MKNLQFLKKTSLAPIKILLIVISMIFMGFFSVKNIKEQNNYIKIINESYFHKNQIINEIYENIEDTKYLLFRLYAHYAFFAIDLEQRDYYKNDIKRNLKNIDEKINKLEHFLLSQTEQDLIIEIVKNKQEYNYIIADILSIIDLDVTMAYMYQNRANEIYNNLSSNVADFRLYFNKSLTEIMTTANKKSLETIVLVVVFAMSGILLAFFVGSLRKDNYLLEKLVNERTAELKANEQNLAITLNSIGDAIIATDTNGLVTRMNPVAEYLTGFIFAEACGKNLNDIFQIVKASNREKAFNPVEKVLETGKTLELENHTILISKNGIEYQIADSASPIKDENGNIKGVVLVFRDVTPEYLIQEKLISIKKAIESTGDAIGMATMSGDIFYQNQAFLDMLGYSNEELTKIKVPKLYKDKDKAYEMYASVTNGKSWVGELEIIKKNGETLFVLLRADIIKNDAGDNIGMVGVHSDITEQKKAQEQTIKMLEKEIAAREQQQNFVSMVSHEFKTPLSIIDSSAQKIVRKIDTIEISEIAERMERIRNNVGRLNTLVESTLSLSKLDSGNLTIKPSINDLKDVISVTVRNIKNFTPDRTINFQHQGKTICNFDPERMSLVVNNLLSNAIKYSSKEINVLCFEDEEYIRLAVKDKGIGISKNDLIKIGERFFRAEHTKSIPGTGIGIYLVKNIIEKHNGYIKIESEKDVGTTFIVSIPKNFENKERDNV